MHKVQKCLKYVIKESYTLSMLICEKFSINVSLSIFGMNTKNNSQCFWKCNDDGIEFERELRQLRDCFCKLFSFLVISFVFVFVIFVSYSLVSCLLGVCTIKITLVKTRINLASKLHFVASRSPRG